MNGPRNEVEVRLRLWNRRPIGIVGADGLVLRRSLVSLGTGRYDGAAYGIRGLDSTQEVPSSPMFYCSRNKPQLNNTN